MSPRRAVRLFCLRVHFINHPSQRIETILIRPNAKIYEIESEIRIQHHVIPLFLKKDTGERLEKYRRIRDYNLIDGDYIQCFSEQFDIFMKEPKSNEEWLMTLNQKDTPKSMIGPIDQRKVLLLKVFYLIEVH